MEAGTDSMAFQAQGMVASLANEALWLSFREAVILLLFLPQKTVINMQGYAVF